MKLPKFAYTVARDLARSLGDSVGIYEASLYFSSILIAQHPHITEPDLRSISAAYINRYATEFQRVLTSRR